MLTISQVTKAFAGRTLFEDASLQVNRGDRVGLVGPNGAGKSTLFSLILGESSPDEGQISIQKSATVGFLPQENAPAGEETVLELACGIKHGSKIRRRGARRAAAGAGIGVAGCGHRELTLVPTAPAQFTTRALAGLWAEAGGSLSGTVIERARQVARR